MITYRGRSGQLWTLVGHDAAGNLLLMPEYTNRDTGGYNQTVLTPAYFAACGFELVEEEANEGET